LGSSTTDQSSFRSLITLSQTEGDVAPGALHRLRLSTPALSGRLASRDTASAITRHVASGSAVTKAELTRTTGLARSSVSTAVDDLLDSGVLEMAGTTDPVGRGRPGDVLVLAEGFGTVLVADVGAATTRLCVSDLSQRSQAVRQVALDVRRGPQECLLRLSEHLDELLALDGRRGPVRVLVIGLPGPVDTHAGRPVRPPIMPGWDGYPVAQELGERYDCPVVVENDVNLRALGEARALPDDQCPLLFVKVGTGIGAGIVTAEGHLHHGADGAAGDIGHVRARASATARCECGATGCIEAVASAAAVLRDLAGHAELDGRSPQSVDDLVELLRARDQTALRRVRQAATDLGEVIAMLVHFYNPARVVLGGLMAEASDDTLAGVRSVVYQSALPLATRNLVLTHPRLGSDAGVSGGLVLGLETALSAEALGRVRPASRRLSTPDHSTTSVRPQRRSS